MTDPTKLSEYLNTAKEAALRAAAVLEDWRPKFQVRQKGRFDLVTDADVASQKTIRDCLLQRFPGHEFLGEEDASQNPSLALRAGARPGADLPPTWIVDPIDGTTNYVHDCPLYCISIGLQIAGVLEVGVVYDPSRREMFAAASGLGAWLGERRLQTSSTKSLEEALVATGFAANLSGNEESLDWWRHFSFKVQSLRRLGSAALNLAYVAAGRFDAFYAFDNHVWDVAGGAVLVREAGGTLTNIDGSAYDPYTPDVLAGNASLHRVLLDHFLRGRVLRGRVHGTP